MLGDKEGLPGLQRGRGRVRVLGDEEGVPAMELRPGLEGVSEIEPARGLEGGGWLCTRKFNILARYMLCGRKPDGLD